METLQFSKDVLQWAASQAGKSLDELARKVSTRSSAEIAEGLLTGQQAVKFAKEAGVPFGYLFLPDAPQARTLPLADFRTLNKSDPLGRDFYEVYDDIENKHIWYKEHLQNLGATPLPFVGRYAAGDASPAQVAKNMREVLDFGVFESESLKSPDELFSVLSAKCEQAGMLVFKNGVVGNNTHRPLSVTEFRGFVICDHIVPVIFVNGADAASAWVFTLAHELAHVWLGESGISDASPYSSNKHERMCNAIAAEFLVPKIEFLSLWNRNEFRTTEGKLEEARRRFKVSGLVVARRALELQLIGDNAYNTIYERDKHNRKKASGGGDFYLTLATRNSRRFSQRVAGLAMSGALSLREAGQLLNTNPNNVVKFYTRQKSIPL